jgi:hypothetical protein
LAGVDRLEEEWGEFVLREALETAADLVGGQAGEDDDGEVGPVTLDVGEDVEAVDLGHLEVEEQEVAGAALEEHECGGAVGGFVDLVTPAAEDLAEGEALGGGIVADE